MYRSRHLALVCAKLGVTLIHARPFQPQAKGKQERWFRTVRTQLLPTLTDTDTRDLEALNRRLWAWKKKELIGNFRNAGREWHPKGDAPGVLVHDFPSEATAKAIPYGVYDMARNEAWVSVGRDHDTPAFAVASIRQ